MTRDPDFKRRAGLSATAGLSCCIVSVPGHHCLLCTVFHCVWQEMLQWQHVPGNVSQYDIVLPPGQDSSHYKFGIASQSYEGWSAGISWATCMFRANSSK